jgi:hypothetical protein
MGVAISQIFACGFAALGYAAPTERIAIGDDMFALNHDAYLATRLVIDGYGVQPCVRPPLL